MYSIMGSQTLFLIIKAPILRFFAALRMMHFQTGTALSGPVASMARAQRG